MPSLIGIIFLENDANHTYMCVCVYLGLNRTTLYQAMRMKACTKNKFRTWKLLVPVCLLLKRIAAEWCSGRTYLK